MGIPSDYYCYILLPKPLGVLVHVFDRMKLAILLSLACLGVRSSPAEEDEDFVHVELDIYLLPSLSGDDHSSPDSVKSRLPAVEFASFFRREGSTAADAEECAVCMGELEAGHEVRELGNCSHAFHRGCIDKWVDVGQLTCPLCRAHLLPKDR